MSKIKVLMLVLMVLVLINIFSGLIFGKKLLFEQTVECLLNEHFLSHHKGKELGEVQRGRAEF